VSKFEAPDIKNGKRKAPAMSTYIKTLEVLISPTASCLFMRVIRRVRITVAEHFALIEISVCANEPGLFSGLWCVWSST
jgi:hypothetical protein